MSIDTYVAQKMRQRREMMAMSQQELVDKLQRRALHPAIIDAKHYESGSHHFTLHDLEVLGWALDVPPKFFLQGSWV